MFYKKTLVSSIGVILGMVAAQPALATEWDRTIDSGTYGATGTITFNDWGYTGPGGRGYNDLDPINGFGGAAQIQHVVTLGPDWQTPDAPATIYDDLGGPLTFNNANVDSAATFFKWAYTTMPGSRFDSMQIDADGDYFVPQNDMAFAWYNTFQYNQVGGPVPGSPTNGDYPQSLAFQPYALSDAKGWCGSVLSSNPGALEAMAGEVTFDFAFDVYFNLGGGNYSYMNTEIVRGFRMTSYGDYSLSVQQGSDLQVMSSSAVVNNTNPADAAAVAAGLANGTAPVDPNSYNLVSFHGADVVPLAADCGILSAEWNAGQRGPGVKKFSSLINAADASSCATAGGSWQAHAFSGYAFFLRADGIRVIEAVDYSLYPDLSNVPNVIDGVAYNYDENGVLQPIANLAPVPVPAAVWLFGSGLLGLAGIAGRKKKA